jgi:hypothetical protein
MSTTTTTPALLTHQLRVVGPDNNTTYHTPSGRRINNRGWTSVPKADATHEYFAGLISQNIIDIRKVEDIDPMEAKTAAVDTTETTSAEAAEESKPVVKPSRKSSGKNKTAADEVAEEFGEIVGLNSDGPLGEKV